MNLELKGRKVVITGASKGIGLSTAENFAEAGANIVLVARGGAALAAAAGQLTSRYGAAVETAALDLAVSGSAETLAAAHGDADILVNNAGDIPRGRIDAIGEAEWRAAWDLKVFGYINMCRAFYAAMKARGQGVIVNVIGAGGERPSADYICGSAGNAALMALTRGLGSASHADGIRVVGINPGPVRTDRFERAARHIARQRMGDADRWQELFAKMPFGRPAEPDEIGATVAFIASPRSAYTSGTIVTIDGSGITSY